MLTFQRSGDGRLYGGLLSCPTWLFHSPVDRAGVRAGIVGLPEVEVVPVYFSTGPAVGQCHLSEGSQRYQCGAKEEGGTHQKPFPHG